jgi:hypothetical protein
MQDISEEYMTDQEILQRIEQLVKEEHELLQRAEQADLDAADHARMKELEVSLDQCWDLLRQRRARRAAGLNPDEAQVRDPAMVEHFQQ